MRVELFDRLLAQAPLHQSKGTSKPSSSCWRDSEHDRFAAEILDVQIIVRWQRVRSTLDVVDLKPVIVHTPKLARAKLT
jgi:hypothetical protein